LKNKNGIIKIIIAGIIFFWLLWLGYRLRKQEDSEREFDNKANDYFRNLDSLKTDSLNQH
jgi:hypothetical protein